MLTRNTPQHCKCNPRASRRGHRFCFSNATVLCVRSKSSLFLLSIFVQFCKVERSIRVELTVHLSVFGGGWGGGCGKGPQGRSKWQGRFHGVLGWPPSLRPLIGCKPRGQRGAKVADADIHTARLWAICGQVPSLKFLCSKFYWYLFFLFTWRYFIQMFIPILRRFPSRFVLLKGQ